MNYEEMYSEFQVCEKEMKEAIAEQQKIFKRLSKNMEKGDLKNAIKDIQSIGAATEKCEKIIASTKEVAENFDAKAYFESGDFTKQMLDHFQKEDVDVKGENFTYEVFPYKVKVDVENLDVYVDRKKVQCFRPQSFVNQIKVSRDKLLSTPFNPSTFANELAAIYDWATIVQSKNKVTSLEPDFYLTVLYKYLAPMRRFRKDYDMQSFAFDIARLYSSDVRETDDGRSFQFGPSRNNKKAIRILDGNGHEQFLATIMFFQG